MIKELEVSDQESSSSVDYVPEVKKKKDIVLQMKKVIKNKLIFARNRKLSWIISMTDFPKSSLIMDLYSYPNEDQFNQV